MQIVFFMATPDDAMRVASSDDLPGDFACEPIEGEGFEALASLAEALGAEARRPARMLTDATCRSFPVWLVGREVVKALGAIGDDAIESAAQKWQPGGDADAYERSVCLGELRAALQTADEAERLCVLFEQSAF